MLGAATEKNCLTMFTFREQKAAVRYLGLTDTCRILRIRPVVVLHLHDAFEWIVDL